MHTCTYIHTQTYSLTHTHTLAHCYFLLLIYIYTSRVCQWYFGRLLNFQLQTIEPDEARPPRRQNVNSFKFSLPVLFASPLQLSSPLPVFKLAVWWEILSFENWLKFHSPCVLVAWLSSWEIEIEQLIKVKLHVCRKVSKSKNNTLSPFWDLPGSGQADSEPLACTDTHDRAVCLY